MFKRQSVALLLLLPVTALITPAIASVKEQETQSISGSSQRSISGSSQRSISGSSQRSISGSSQRSISGSSQRSISGSSQRSISGSSQRSISGSSQRSISGSSQRSISGSSQRSISGSSQRSISGSSQRSISGSSQRSISGSSQRSISGSSQRSISGSSQRNASDLVLFGPITLVGSTNIAVLGQTVDVDGISVAYNVSGHLAYVKAIQENGAFVAKEVRVFDDYSTPGATIVLVSGRVNGVYSDVGLVTIGDLEIDITSLGVSISVGDSIALAGIQPIAGGRIIAYTVSPADGSLIRKADGIVPADLALND